MKQLKNIFKKRRSHPLPTNGFGMSEAVVAAGAGILLIGASALALRSTQNLIDRSESKSTLRQNTTNGLRLLRSEVERSIHILVNNKEAVAGGMEHTDMGNDHYQETLNECGRLAKDRSQVFKPVFGIKMVELNAPVIYGLGISSNNQVKNDKGLKEGSGYALLRCGAPLSLDGRYSETEEVFISKAIEDIGVMKCTKPEGDCEQPKNKSGYAKNLKEIINDLDITFTADKTPVRTFREPAFGIMTDKQRKLVKFIDPNPESKNEEESYLESRNAANRRITRYPLYLAAFARADKRQEQYGDNGDSVISGAYFRNVSSKRVRFLVDGSGSMSACILWGSTYGNWKIYWSGSYYFWSRKNCALTRMESLQSELISLLTAIDPDTKVSIQSFSSPGRSNHRTWRKSSNGLVKIGDDGIRESAIKFVQSLDNDQPTKWGGTYPWQGLDAAFEDNETDTLYFLSDGEPNKDRLGGNWGSNDYEPTANHYSNFNNTRTRALKTNTISLGLESPWMEKLSTQTTGDHLKVDKDYVTSNSSK
ncbi:MAG: vWA domain-containing protein [Prochlorococcaceae cyanobacterium ETNP2_MAG_10]|nr:vWA domain-containing protein [Prochlorococcaceae cyanobacterium ETNP2_MAG_10]